MKIRQLNANDIEAVLVLARHRGTYMKIPKESVQSGLRKSWPKEKVEANFDSQLEIELKSYFLTNSFLHQLFGAFNEAGRLESVLGMTFQAARPLWTLSRMIARPELNLARNGLGELYEHCLLYAENLGIPDYLTCVPERHARAYDRAWQGAAPRRYAYQVELEERVMPGERPFYASHFRIMGHVAWPVPMLIRRHSLTGAERERVISLRGNLRKLLEEKYGAYADVLEQSSIEISGSFA